MPSIRLILKALGLMAGFLVAALSVGLLGFIALYLYIAPQLPGTSAFEGIQLEVPMRIYSHDGKLIAEYGDERRSPIHYQDMPPRLIQAVLAAEDDRFFQHPGVDYQGLLRAALKLLMTGHKREGGSTITMQVARNFFLSSEKTYQRKLKEIFLALKIERELNKQQIMELYLNKIYLGQRTFGVEAAAQVYYGKSVSELDLPELAMLAGLPKAPSALNPITNPAAARKRRDHVLYRMQRLGFIDQAEYEQALAAPVAARWHKPLVALNAPYVAELALQMAVRQFGEVAYRRGYRIYVSIDSRLQQAAQAAVRANLLAYDRRHGYRGPAGHIDMASLPAHRQGTEYADWSRQVEHHLAIYREVADLMPALVAASDAQAAYVYVNHRGLVRLPWQGMAWAQPYLGEDELGPRPQQVSDVVAVGDIVYVRHVGPAWQLSQLPKVQGSLLALGPFDGRILAMVGGFDFQQSPFNRAVQAQRQPGSGFKPFFYAAALDKGYTPASVFNDAPLVFNNAGTDQSWRPENYSGIFYGPTRLREALVQSRNLVSVRLLQRIGIRYAINYVQRFGFKPQQMPRDLTLALGTLTASPLEMARAYAVFANGGYRIEPYLIERVEDLEGRLIYQGSPQLACDACLEAPAAPQQEATPATPEQAVASVDSVETQAVALTTPASPAQSQPAADTDEAARTVADRQAAWRANAQLPWNQIMRASIASADYVPDPPRYAPKVLDDSITYMMTSMMRDVVRRGTGTLARSLGRADLAAKTGTTNEARDAWFNGFNAAIVTVGWVGFDRAKPLGNGEVGSRTAGPMWVDFMRTALQGVPEQPLIQPPGLVTVRISPRTGMQVSSDDPNGIFEVFPARRVPAVAQRPPDAAQEGAPADTQDSRVIQDLF